MLTLLSNFYRSSVGKKFIVAVTGTIMVLFLVGHMVGNLQIFEGRGATPELTKLNQYAALLRKEMALLWAVRLGMIATVFLHVVTTIQLTLQNMAARGDAYAERRWVKTTLASRTMIYGGIAVFLYVVYHVLHFTTGTVHTDLFVHGDVYSNVIRSFQSGWISAVYIAAQVFLFFHLVHGVQSAVQTMGVSHPSYVALAKIGGTSLALVVTIGFTVVPVAVLAGWIS